MKVSSVDKICDSVDKVVFSGGVWGICGEYYLRYKDHSWIYCHNETAQLSSCSVENERAYQEFKKKKGRVEFAETILREFSGITIGSGNGGCFPISEIRKNFPEFEEYAKEYFRKIIDDV